MENPVCTKTTLISGSVGCGHIEGVAKVFTLTFYFIAFQIQKNMFLPHTKVRFT